MAKRVVWTDTASKQRREILKYWAIKNGSKTYSKKISKAVRNRIQYLVKFNYIGTETDVKDLRVTSIEHFSLYYKIQKDTLVILCMWDNRRDPDELVKILK